MANTVSAVKRIRQTARKTAHNQARKSRFRHQVRTMKRLLEEKDSAAAQAMLPRTFSLIDRAAQCGIIKKNTAARYKSRLTVRLRALASK